MTGISNTSKLEKGSYKRVLIVINKWWECNPVMNVLSNDNARPAAELGWPQLLRYPCKKHELFCVPRAVFSLSNIRAEVWCISDLLAKYPDTPQYQSSSERKMEQMASIFKYSNQSADLVVAVGTAAAYPPDVSINGSVITGTKVFMHNCHPKGSNPYSNWESNQFDIVIDSHLKESDFEAVTDIETIPPSVMDRFLVPPLNPDPAGGKLIADYDFVALSAINVTDYAEYYEMDKKTLSAYQMRYNPAHGKSIDTTHGLIRVVAGISTPFLFVSGIVNRLGHYKEDVDPRPYAQNTTGAHNAGIVVAWMLLKINTLYSRNL